MNSLLTDMIDNDRYDFYIVKWLEGTYLIRKPSLVLESIGSKLPSKKLLDEIIESGELRAPTLILDLDAHKAMIKKQMQAVREEEMEGEIDLNKLALNTSTPYFKNKEKACTLISIKYYVLWTYYFQ